MNDDVTTWSPELVKFAVFGLAKDGAARETLTQLAFSLAWLGFNPDFAIGARDYLQSEKERQRCRSMG